MNPPVSLLMNAYNRPSSAARLSRGSSLNWTLDDLMEMSSCKPFLKLQWNWIFWGDTGYQKWRALSI